MMISLFNKINSGEITMIKFCSCGNEVEIDRDNEPINIICDDCEHAIDMEKEKEESRNNISRNGPWHNV